MRRSAPRHGRRKKTARRPRKKTSSLQRPIRIVEVTGDHVTVGTDRVYAAIHQFGGQTPAHLIRAMRTKALAWKNCAHPVKVVHHPGSNIPARPFFPFLNGELTPLARERIKAIAEGKIEAMLEGR